MLNNRSQALMINKNSTTCITQLILKNDKTILQVLQLACFQQIAATLYLKLLSKQSAIRCKGNEGKFNCDHILAEGVKL